MNKSFSYRINKSISSFVSWLTHIARCPEIRWNEVVHIKAIGTDAIGPFAVSIIFTYSDGSQTTIHPEMRGYCDIIESLRDRYPSIASNW